MSDPAKHGQRHQVESIRIPFGKYAGKTLDEVSQTDEGLRYLDWMVGLKDLRDPFRRSLIQFVTDPTIQREIEDVLKK